MLDPQVLNLILNPLYEYFLDILVLRKGTTATVSILDGGLL